MTVDRFKAGWLALREPVDHRSRAHGLAEALSRACRLSGWTRIIDLGTGTGSNLRYLAPRLPPGQRWTLVDNDPDLLGEVGTQVPGVVEVVRKLGDLGDVGLDAVASADVVTGSALLDLVSEIWLRQLVDACCSTLCGVFFALSYDGSIEWSSGGAGADTTATDALVSRLVNAHQRRDKGLGRALGPEAVSIVRRMLEWYGFETQLEESHWFLGRRDRDLTRALVNGWASAALEESPADRDRIVMWAECRLRKTMAGDCGLRVGHADLLALPPRESRSTK